MMDFDEHNEPRHGHMEGGVTMDSAKGERTMHGTSPSAKFEFGAKGELKTAHLERGVRPTQKIRKAKLQEGLILRLALPLLPRLECRGDLTQPLWGRQATLCNSPCLRRFQQKKPRRADFGSGPRPTAFTVFVVEPTQKLINELQANSMPSPPYRQIVA